MPSTLPPLPWHPWHARWRTASPAPFCSCRRACRRAASSAVPRTPSPPPLPRRPARPPPADEVPSSECLGSRGCSRSWRQGGKVPPVKGLCDVLLCRALPPRAPHPTIQEMSEYWLPGDSKLSRNVGNHLRSIPQVASNQIDLENPLEERSCPNTQTKGAEARRVFLPFVQVANK